jgi:hypothetical protein
MSRLPHELRDNVAFDELFKVEASNHPMATHIGKKVYRRRVPECLNDPSVYQVEDDIWVLAVGRYDMEKEDIVYDDKPALFHIDQIQKIYDGTLAYRIYGENDHFGSPARADEVYFVRSYELTDGVRPLTYEGIVCRYRTVDQAQVALSNCDNENYQIVEVNEEPTMGDISA